jgi:hypothetical protein
MRIEGSSIHDKIISVSDLLDEVDPPVLDGIEMRILSVNTTVKTVQVNS